ncbi:MAG: hypothetical protein F6K55_23170 [Moorea sp. SIO4A3]|nr:hypothetical protein [Moorena sp. SIO4A3]
MRCSFRAATRCSFRAATRCSFRAAARSHLSTTTHTLPPIPDSRFPIPNSKF